MHSLIASLRRTTQRPTLQRREVTDGSASVARAPKAVPGVRGKTAAANKKQTNKQNLLGFSGIKNSTQTTPKASQRHPPPRQLTQKRRESRIGHYAVDLAFWEQAVP